MNSAIAKAPQMIYNVYHKGGNFMKVIVSKWGNSVGLRIPKSISDQLSIKDGDAVSCEVKGNKMIVKKRISTREMYENFYGKPYDEITSEDIGNGGEIDWGPDVGGEIIE